MAKLIFQGITPMNAAGTTPGGSLVESVDDIGPDANGNVPLGAYTKDTPPPATQFEAGETTSLPAGSEPVVTFDKGADGVQVVNFQIPEGQPGADGQDGESIQGEPGPPNQLTVGETITGEPGTDAQVEIVGDAPSQVINFTIPRGADGTNGSGSGGVASVNGILPDENGNVDTGSYGPDNPPPIFVAGFNMPGTMGLFAFNQSGVTALDPDDTTTGSSLKYAGLTNSTTGYSIVQYSSNSPPGTWVLRGDAGAAVDSTVSASFFIRIDGTSLMSASSLLQAMSASAHVRNCRYSSPDNSRIDCEVLIGERWYPFTATPDDRTSWGPQIYASAVAGNFGVVESYN